MKTGIYGVISCMIGGMAMLFTIKGDYQNAMKDYQLEIKGNAAKLYDQNRLIGTVPLNKIDSLIINDNQ